ncbi:MAG TPA: hypothetical protein VHW65_00525 [Gemmatimonadales bacterium]|jgi:hypothetical protein|nr:hypothetical protein [Gemmatimonadales bacterium]
MLLQTSAGLPFAPIDNPDLHPVPQEMAASCPAVTGLGRDALLRLEDRDASAASDHAAESWTDLACVRLALWQNGALSRQSALMTAGDTWLEGAAMAAMHAVRDTPKDPRANSLLADVVVNGDALGPVALAADSVLLAAARSGIGNPAIFRACATVALRMGDAPAARVCARAGLHAGADSTWHDVTLSRLSFRDHDTVAGTALFLQAVAAIRDTADRRVISWHLQWFLTPAENKAWDTVTAGDRERWVRDRLASRDVRDARPPGSRLAAHFERLDTVDVNFRMNIPRNRRDAARTLPAVDPDLGRLIDVDSFVRANSEPGAVHARVMREYKRWQTDYDDRGVVWLRYGAPDHRVIWPCTQVGPPCETVRELWTYDIGGQELLLNFENEAFSGEVAATRLVTGVLGSYFCGVDARRCLLTEESKMAAAQPPGRNAGRTPFVTLETMESLHQVDQSFITEATTTDDNSVRHERPIMTVAHLSRLWDPATGAVMALGTYALRIDDLAAESRDGKRAVEVNVSLRQWDGRLGAWYDTTIVRRAVLPPSTSGESWLTGLVVAPSSAAVREWSLAAEQQTGRLGRAYQTGGVALADGPIALSDLILGSARQDLAWDDHGTAVPLAPLNGVVKSAPIALYYQVRSAGARGAITTTVVIYPIKDSATAKTPALSIASSGALRTGINEVARSVDASRLGKGTYLIEVRLSDQTGVIARRTATLSLK